MNNITKMQGHANDHDKALRPHAKSHKCSQIAKLQIERGAIGICTAKLSEAEALAKAGIENLLITGPVVTEAKLHRLVELSGRVESLIIVVDDVRNAMNINRVARFHNTRVDVLIDIDIGLRRTGVPPASAIRLAEMINSLDRINLRGIQAYAGHAQHIVSFAQRRKDYIGCLEMAEPIFSQINRDLGGSALFSAGGTGTHAIDVEIPYVTELQPGSYPLMDAEYLSIEPFSNDVSDAHFAPSLTLLTTVLSVNHPGFAIVDAGLKSLYKDGGTPFLLDKSLRYMKYDWAGDEYGRISCDAEHSPPKVGAVLELVVSHCDPTVNLFDNLCVIKDNIFVENWPIDLRGLSQ